MDFIKRIEKPAFYILFVGFILTILTGIRILPQEFRIIAVIFFFVLGIYYFPILLVAINYNGFKKKNIVLDISGYVLSLTCAFLILINFQLGNIAAIDTLGKITAIVNGVLFIWFLLLGKEYLRYFIQHFLVNTMLLFIILDMH
jgi:hypothetical protein